MPERIPTATIARVDSDVLEVNDVYPGTYGFSVRLSRDPGEEWATEFDAAYVAAPYAGKPPVVVRGDALLVYYLPRYAADLPRYLQFLTQVVRDTNEAVTTRNSVLPDEEQEKTAFRARLREAGRVFGD